MEIVNFDIIPVNWIWKKIFFMPPSQQLPLRFATLGMNDSSLLNNNGGIIISILTVTVLFSLTFTVRQIKRHKKTERVRDLSHKL
jgi:hypothetical protein